MLYSVAKEVLHNLNSFVSIKHRDTFSIGCNASLVQLLRKEMIAYYAISGRVILTSSLRIDHYTWAHLT